MSIINNLKENNNTNESQTQIPEHFPYSDTLFDYGKYLREIQQQGIGKYQSKNHTVAIVGTGVAGIITAYELLKCGVPNITLYTPDDIDIRPYGRCQSVPFANQTGKGNPIIAELGAMRFPISEVAFFHYLQEFNIPYSYDFPDPGLVNTLLYVNGKSHVWKAGDNPPSTFDTVSQGWNALINEGFTTNSGVVLTAPAEIAKTLKNMDTKTASIEWQKWIHMFTSISFRSALSVIFQTSNTPPGGKKWTEEDIQLFGTLGIGSGGFNPIYPASFTEMLRLLVNELEVKQQFIPSGIQSVFEKIATTPVGPNKQTVKENIIQVKDIPVLNVDSITDTSNPHQYKLSVGEHTIDCDYIIWALPTWSLQIYYKGGMPKIREVKSSHNVEMFGNKQLRAVANQHLIASNKIFVQTRTKFWLKDPETFPNIQSDTLGHGLYCLDYNPDDPDGYGVVLISYTWEDDAKKIEAFANLPDDEKASIILNSTGNIPKAEKTIATIKEQMMEVKSVFWALDTHYNGAFKLNHPGQDIETQSLYWDFTKCQDKDTDSQIYFAGDSGSFYAGWIEGALQTGINAATAVMVSLARDGHADNIVKNNPVSLNSAKVYDYTGK